MRWGGATMKPAARKARNFLTVHGAEHAVSYYHDNAAYTAQVTDFLQDCLTRRGFVWPPEADKDKQA